MRVLRSLWCGLLVVLAPGTAAAAHDAQIDLEHLPNGYRTRPLGLTTLANGTSCTVSPMIPNCTATVRVDGTERRLEISDACGRSLMPGDADGWANASLAFECQPSGGGTETVTVRWGAGDPVAVRIDGGMVLIGSPGTPAPDGARLVVWDDSEGRGVWKLLVPSQLQASDLNNISETSSGFYSADGTNWSVATIARTTTARPSRSSDDVCGERLDAERFCARELRRQGACFAETRTGDLQLVRTSPEDHIIRANTSFTVVACIESNHTLRGELSGTAGLTDPAIDDQRAGRTSSGGDSGVSRAASPRYRRVWLRFPPRQPGPPVDLVVRLRDANNAQIDEVETEFVVEQTYAGALRLGIGVPLFAVQREYTAELVPGSAQREIVASGSDADVELVITFAGFLEALYGGRSYTRPHWNAFEHWGLFVAAGVLSPRPQGVDFLTSIYLGVELELVRSLSLGVGFVLRRVNRLIAGYDVGDAVEAGTKLAAESWEPGLGFVIGVSPDFLQFAGALGGE